MKLFPPVGSALKRTSLAQSRTSMVQAFAMHVIHSSLCVPNWKATRLTPRSRLCEYRVEAGQEADILQNLWGIILAFKCTHLLNSNEANRTPLARIARVTRGNTRTVHDCLELLVDYTSFNFRFRIDAGVSKFLCCEQDNDLSWSKYAFTA